VGRSPLSAYQWLNRRASWVLGIGTLGLLFSAYRQWKKLSAQRNNQPSDTLPKLPVLDEYPRVSLLVPAWNEGRYISQCLSSALGLRYPNKEIIVCAGGQDGTYPMAKTFEEQGVIVLEQTPGMGKQGALQRCFKHSSGEIIYLTDADCLLEDASFEATIAPILGGKESVATGYFEPFPESRSNWLVEYQWRQHSMWQHSQPQNAPTLDGRNAAVKREVLEAIGAFTIPAPIGTDYTLSQLIISHGYRIRSLPHSRVKTHYPGTTPEYLLQLSRWYRNRLVLGMRYRAWDDVLNSLRAGGSAGILLGVPLLGWFGSPLLFGLWLLTAYRALLQNWLVIASHRPYGEAPISARELRMAILCTPINLLGMARGLLQSLLPGADRNW
jgi:cellulose synthase/poly-beta-1,6-N-acetylglucosamine synthase-like glycosyltransferase